MPTANTVIFKAVQLLPVYFIPCCLLLFFHWRIIVNYQLMQTRRDRLRTQFQEIVKKMVELREKIDGIDAAHQQQGAGTKHLGTSANDYMKPAAELRLTPVESESLASAIRDVKKGAAGEHVIKKIRFSHVVDLETARVDTLSCCSKPSQMSCSSVDPSLETNKDEIKKIMLIKEERNLRRIRAAYGILWLAAQSDDYVMWDTLSGEVRRQRRRDLLNAFGPKGHHGCCRLRSPTMHVLVALASTAFLVLNTPFCVWYVISHMFPGDTPLETVRNNLASNSVLLLAYLSSTMNFVFYSTLSSKFQVELCKCLTCYKNRRSENDHSDTLTSPRESHDETNKENNAS
ncbi:hypothetical protein Btru_022268 [Bulinus truncatus]|nr:hypothetical protein Btru_022268 [Bulinus truncatus]